ncbi:hypothetical protein M0R04_07110 [Candidatus Dojkabacteria bacterium]|jgi:hypothetical protein|nr:hypothetical protein [Candidatus Dojkabacteria bacterium]
MGQTFKQYLESKEQLMDAIKNTPVSTIEYEIYKYCSIPVAECDVDAISLRPKNKILIEWSYDDIHNPTPLSIKFKGVKDIDEDDQYNLNIPRIKLQKFLDRHTK